MPGLAFSQQPRSPKMPAPPPMLFVSRDERSQLTASKDPKTRLRLTIDLSLGHLSLAESHTSQGQFTSAAEEMGRYLGLVDDARVFLLAMNRDKDSTRDLFRRFELALRAQLPRLAVMRRDTPADYSGNIRMAEEFVKSARSEALDSFYGRSVLREGAPVDKRPESVKDPSEENKRP
jgi:hypothetical protein